jgi:ATP-dependent DNA ligase
VLPKLTEPVRYSPTSPPPSRFSFSPPSVKVHGFEGLVAKRYDSVYEPGQRSGAWMKMRVNRGQEFVIGGYTRGTKSFDALVFGYYDGDTLIYVARTRNGFTPASRGSCSRSSNDSKRRSARSRMFLRRRAADGDRA